MLIFIKMETQSPHPHAMVADFVNKFEGLIKPELKKGNLGVTPVIADVCARFGIFEKLELSVRSDIYAKYRMAIQYLGGLLEGNTNQRGLDMVVLHVDRYVAEIDQALWENPNYKSERRVVAWKKNFLKKLKFHKEWKQI